MTRLQRVFVVQPYWRSPKGLAAGKGSRHKTEGEARQYADRLIPVFECAHVLSMEVCEQMNFCGEAELVASFGEVPGVG